GLALSEDLFPLFSCLSYCSFCVGGFLGEVNDLGLKVSGLVSSCLFFLLDLCAFRFERGSLGQSLCQLCVPGRCNRVCYQVRFFDIPFPCSVDGMRAKQQS